MKNILIGTKILLGFAVVIAMVVIITVSVVISSNSITSATDDVKLYNEFNEIVTETYDNFYASRLLATRFNIRYSTDVWDSFAAAFGNTDAAGEKGFTLINDSPLLSGYNTTWTECIRLLDDYFTSMENVRNAYREAEAAKNILIEIGPEIVFAVQNMYEAQHTGTIGQIRAGDPPEELVIKLARINDTVEINNLVTIMRINVSRMLENYSAENVAEVKDSIEAVRARMEEYKGILRTQTSIDIAQNAIDRLDAYDNSVVIFIAEQEVVATERLSAERLGVEALANLDDKARAIEESLAAAIDAAESASNAARSVAIAVAGAAIVVSILIALGIKRAITKPILFISDLAAKIAEEGDLEQNAAEIEKHQRFSEGKDESAQIAANFGRLINRLREVDDCLTSIAANDLTAEFHPLSEKDVMGIALQSMLTNLNSMFSDINSSSAQVSSGSKQVADGAQALAQGSTQQAASVQQLSSSISEIAVKTKSNAEMAGQAASLADTIKSSAEKGSRQMDEMMIAVGDINEASQSISKVIKTIDDIAFQTNILALNAAVDAARAGQHGKGFAVVAEEVRNLAAKSAEAAKNTGGLIENSIDKANLGVRIAGETAESLTAIVSGINESDRLVGEIARSSEEQSLAIDQLNIGVDQVARVVQQNSATAEQSAAASQEMSGQSDFLLQLISQFKLVTEAGRPQSLPSAYDYPREYQY